VRWHPVRKLPEESPDPVAAAEREVETSRKRLADTHEKVVRPLRAAAERNNFAELIRASLIQGHRNGG